MFLEGVGCRRGGAEVFRGVDARVREGGALWVRGANGCGKTSLLRICAGLLAPAAGRVEARGGGAACFVGEKGALRGEASGRENLRFWAAFFGSGEEGVERGAARFRLEEFWDAPVARLSAGQRRRVALARLYAGDFALWLLDEPAVGLDEAARGWLNRAIAEHRGGGGMVAVASHESMDLPECEVLRLDAERYRPDWRAAA